MEYEVVGNSKAARLVRAVVPSMIKQLGLENSKHCFVIHFTKDEIDCGATVPIEQINSSMVIINSTRRLSEIIRTVAHELVHVKQHAKGQLKQSDNHYIWMGKKIPKTVAYLDMPWEKEAFAKQELIMRRAIEE
jgi:Zn-dependent peptidase ImmA (M78 family)